MDINKKFGLLVLPLLGTGVIGVAAASGTPKAHAATPVQASSQAQVKTTEPNDTPDSSKPETANKENDNIQSGPQNETGAPDVNQSGSETAN